MNKVIYLVFITLILLGCKGNNEGDNVNTVIINGKEVLQEEVLLSEDEIIENFKLKEKESKEKIEVDFKNNQLEESYKKEFTKLKAENEEEFKKDFIENEEEVDKVQKKDYLINENYKN